jgi:hypothetical protein
MTMYEYVAMSNPRGAKSLIESFGYRVTNPRTMGANLRMLVAQEGEDALKEIAKMHPDKELIMEVCGGRGRDGFMGLDGILSEEQSVRKSQSQNESNESTKLAYQTNAMMLVVAVIIASAIIVNQKK